MDGACYAVNVRSIASGMAEAELDECLRNLRSLNASELPDVVEISTVNGLTAADGARSSALHAAQAVDTPTNLPQGHS